eukprot:4396793-Amphidinium_carterae.1
MAAQQHHLPHNQSLTTPGLRRAIDGSVDEILQVMNHPQPACKTESQFAPSDPSPPPERQRTTFRQCWLS